MMNRILTVVISLFLFTIPFAVSAQDDELGKTFQIERFEPDPVLPKNAWHVSRSDILGHLSPSGTILGHFARRQLVIDRDGTEQQLVHSKVEGQIALALGLYDWVELGIALPVVFFQAQDLEGFGQDPDEDLTRVASVGDVRIIPKVRILRPEWAVGFGAAISATLYAPLTEGTNFESDAAFRIAPRLVLDWSHPVGFAVAANIGYDLRPDHGVLDYSSDDVFRYGFALVIPTVWEPFKIIGNLFGDLDASSPEFGNGSNEPVEAIGGFQFDLPDGITFGIGGGGGLNSVVGAPQYRFWMGFGYARGAQDRDGDGIVDSKDRCPLRREDKDGDRDEDGCPDEDRDGDGIEDDKDECPSLAEDTDGFEDGDGCPDPDNDNDGLVDLQDRCPDVEGPSSNEGCPMGDRDGDGISDADDQCPDEPEDKDGTDDADGCPDLDDDFDGIPDTKDRCPKVAEDPDGFQDEDGCPDDDNDGDGIKDGVDNCPNEREVFNEYRDEDGCPDEAKSKVKVGRDKITITEKIFFKTGSAKIEGRSFDILKEIAQALKDNPQVKKLQIEGHTDRRGAAKKNLELSQRRAESVLDFLVGEGIKASRLTARGFGEERPISTNATSEGREQNRRVEFTILR